MCAFIVSALAFNMTGAMACVSVGVVGASAIGWQAAKASAAIEADVSAIMRLVKG